MNSNNILEVKDLTVDFRTEDGNVRAVNNSSFTLEKGKTIGIVGESGSGKSVTSLSVMQLIPNPPGKISNGEIWFNSPNKGPLNLLALKRDARGKAPMAAIRGNEISMIFQEPMTSLNPVFTCGEQVIEAIRTHQRVSKKEATERTLALFREVELPRPEQILKAYPHQISGGQKQRVMIAMAMSCNPALLIADEPTTALDVTVQKRILDLMEELRVKHDMGIIFITHDLGVIAEIADDVIVMYRGNIVETGSVKQIFDDPQHPYTKGLIACRPPMEKRYTHLPTVTDFMDTTATGEIVEKAASVDDMLAEVEISSEEYRQRQDDLQTQRPILTVEHLKTYFPVRGGFFGGIKNHVKAVDDVSFEVYPGEKLGLVGESGCGKTTLGRTLLRLIEPTAGKVTFEDTEITALTQAELRKHRRDLQIIFQDPYGSLNPRMTIGNAILEPMKVHGILGSQTERKDRVRELLERVNLRADHYNRYPHEFSGGQRQRICIARTLALRPRFVICDESVSALDVSVQAQVLNLLDELREEFNLTYIFISHDLSVVKYMSDRMIVMKDGKIEEMGVADDIYANPSSAYTRELISAIPRGRMQDIEAAMQRRAEADAAAYKQTG